MPRRAALALLVASVLVIGACSSSGDGDDASTSTTQASEQGSDTTAPEVDPSDPPAEGDEPAPTTEPEGEGSIPQDPACAALQVIVDYDVQASEVVNSSEWTEVQAFFVDKLPDVVAAYDDAIEAAPEVAAELEVLRDFTASTATAVEGAADLEGFADALYDLPGVQEAGAAGMALNTWAEDNCGFSTGNN